MVDVGIVEEFGGKEKRPWIARMALKGINLLGVLMKLFVDNTLCDGCTHAYVG